MLVDGGISFVLKARARPSEVLKGCVGLAAVLAGVVVGGTDLGDKVLVPGCSLLDHFDDANVVFAHGVLGGVGGTEVDAVQLCVHLPCVGVGIGSGIDSNHDYCGLKLLMWAVCDGKRWPTMGVHIKIGI